MASGVGSGKVKPMQTPIQNTEFNAKKNILVLIRIHSVHYQAKFLTVFEAIRKEDNVLAWREQLAAEPFLEPGGQGGRGETEEGAGGQLSLSHHIHRQRLSAGSARRLLYRRQYICARGLPTVYMQTLAISGGHTVCTGIVLVLLGLFVPELWIRIHWIRIQHLKWIRIRIQGFDYKIFLCLCVIFAILDPDPDSGYVSRDQTECGSNPDPDP